MATIQECKEKYPPGTEFCPAHLNDCFDDVVKQGNTITVHELDTFEYNYASGEVKLVPHNGRRLKVTPYIYDNTKGFAKIISKPEISNIPDNWALKVTDSNYHKVNLYRRHFKINIDCIKIADYPYIKKLYGEGTKNLDNTYPLITDIQFDSILKELGLLLIDNTKKAFPKEWQLLVTENNLKAVNEFRKTKGRAIINLKEWNYTHIEEGGDGRCGSAILAFLQITDEDFTEITGIKIDKNKIVPIPDGRRDCIVIRCIKDCHRYKIGDITWVTSSWTKNGILKNIICPEDNIHRSNYHDCFELVEDKTITKDDFINICEEIPLVSESKLPEEWVVKITEENIELLDRFRKHVGIFRGLIHKSDIGGYVDNDSFRFVDSRPESHQIIITNEQFIEYLKSIGVDTSTNIKSLIDIQSQMRQSMEASMDINPFPIEAVQARIQELKIKKQPIQVYLIPVKQRRII